MSRGERTETRLPEVLEAEPRALGRRLTIGFVGALGVVALLSLLGQGASLWAIRGATAGARLEAVILEQQALAAELQLASRATGAKGATDRSTGLPASDPRLARFLRNAVALAEGDPARGLPRPGADAIGVILFEAPHGLAAAMQRFADAVERRAAPDMRGLVAGLGLARQLAAERAMASAMRAERLAGLLGVVEILAVLLAGILVFRPAVRQVLARMRRLIAAHDAVQHAAFHDPLTGLPNRDNLMLRLDLILSDPGLTGQIVAVVEVDLARFVAETDGLGREIADEALRQAGARFAALARQEDVVAKLDGPVLLGVFTDVLDEEELAALGRRAADALANPVRIGPLSIRLGPTIGIAAATGGRVIASPAVEAAHRALAAARRRGIGAIEILGPETVEELVRSTQAARQVAASVAFVACGDRLAAEALDPLFTPVVELAGGRIAGFWAAAPAPLLQGGDREGGEGATASATARLGLYEAPGDLGFVLSPASRLEAEGRVRAFDHFAAWRDEGAAPGFLGVSVAPSALADPDFCDRLALELDGAGLVPRDLMLALPAEALLGPRDLALADSIARLGRAGTRLALVLGPGVPALPVPRPERGLGFGALVLAAPMLGASGGPDRALRTAALRLARDSATPVLAAGIEDASRLPTLVRQGCSLGVGTLWGTGMQASRARALLSDVMAREPGKPSARWRRG